MRKFLVAAGMTLAFTASSMFGGQIVQTLTFGPGSTDVKDPASVQTFNDFLDYGTGGNLTSVTLEVSITETIAGLSIFNNSATADSFNYQSVALFAINGTAPDQGALEAALPTTFFTLFNMNFNNLAAGGTVNPVPPAASVTKDTGVINGTTSAYNTFGTFTLSYDTLTGESVLGGGGNEKVTQTTNSNATYSVIYNYSDPTPPGAPEPATMTLFGSALLGIGFFASKRSKKS
jgi:hypothetical protein